jgi:hypothetical protein
LKKKSKAEEKYTSLVAERALVLEREEDRYATMKRKYRRNGRRSWNIPYVISQIYDE